ncbi:MAG TPA: cysteine desulfurase family protein [Patescibacteria group bacterium]|nr:cysteine desulfurase family protein [Patescibacteria group bacterium]
MPRKKIYLDYAAATPIDKDVISEMQPFFSDKFYNPSATYLPAVDVKNHLTDARKSVANCLGSKSREIIFTAGATEANNLAISGLMTKYPRSNIVYSAIEHESVIETAKQYNHKIVNVNKDGRVNLEDLDKKIDDQTALVSIMFVNNEIGTIEPLSQVAKLIEEKKKTRKNNIPLLLHSDAAQAANYLDLHTSRLKIDMMSLSGPKIYGPKQSGCLYIKSGIVINPIIYGGGQEFNLRSGTENVAGVIGFAKALDKAQSTRNTESKRLNNLKDYFISEIQSNLKNVFINGSLKHRIPNNIHLTIPGVDSETLLLKLEQRGILAANGAACSANSGEPSYILSAIGLIDNETRSSIRISIG